MVATVLIKLYVIGQAYRSESRLATSSTFKLDQEAFDTACKKLSAEITEEFVKVLKKINVEKVQQQAEKDAPMPAAVIPPVPNSWSSYLNAFFINMSIHTYIIAFLLSLSRICRVICIAFL